MTEKKKPEDGTEEELDEALDESFPASDPPSPVAPASDEDDKDRKKD